MAISATIAQEVMAEIRRVVEVQVKADLACRWAGEEMPAEDIAKLLGVSANTVYRYLKRRNGSHQAG